MPTKAVFVMAPAAGSRWFPKQRLVTSQVAQPPHENLRLGQPPVLQQFLGLAGLLLDQRPRKDGGQSHGHQPGQGNRNLP